MKIQLLTICMYLSIVASAQTFQWDNDSQSQAQVQTQAPPPNYSTSQVMPKGPMIDEMGIAHPYPDYYDGSPTALGEVFHQNELTAGHKTLPLGTIVKIARIDNGLSTMVRINDRGAYCDGCIIDLSTAAAQQIGLTTDKKTNVTLTVMGLSGSNPADNIAAANTPHLAERGESKPVPNTYESKPVSTQYNTPTTDCRTQPTNEEIPAQQARGAATPNNKGIIIIDAPIAPFAVQLGSYTNYSNAEQHALSLQDKGFNNVYVLQEKRLDQKPLNRVIVTPFASLTEAESYINDLQQYHKMKGLVFQTMLIEVEN